MNFAKISMLILIVGLCLTSCVDEVDPLNIPNEYSGEDFSTSATAELAILTTIKGARDEAFKGRTNGQAVSDDILNTFFTIGDPSLKHLITDYYSNKLEGTDGYFSKIALASGNTYTLGDLGSEGGTFGDYLFDEHAIDLEQTIEKGMFGSVLFNHATELLGGTLDNTTTDRVLAIFGSNPTFPNSNDATKHETPDKYVAGYAARRDKGDGTGFYTNIKSNLIKLQAAIKAGDDYKKDQQQAIVAIEENWEKSNAATVIFYLNEVISKLSETDPTDKTKSSALHSLGECIGFMDGMHGVNASDKIISDDEIDQVLALFLAPQGASATVFLFAINPETNLPKLQQAISTLKTIYGFSDQQMEEFKINWVAVQSR